MWTYAEYMQSDAWRARRDAYFRKHQKMCRACQATKRIHLHHLDYANMGNEPDDDLMPLCELCHDIAHQLHRANRGRMTIREATLRSIRWGQKETERRIVRAKRRNKPKGRSNGRRKRKLSEVERHNQRIRQEAHNATVGTRKAIKQAKDKERERIKKQQDQELMARYGATSIREYGDSVK